MNRSFLLFVSAFVLSVGPAMASTFYVGTCHKSSFASISTAVVAVPAGSIINVCPGTALSEQVIISKSLTLQGMPSPNVNQAKLDGGTGGITTQSLVLATNLKPTIWITAGTVNISNLSISADSRNTNVCPVVWPAILYASGSSGTVNHVSIFADAKDCGAGIWAENASNDPSSVKIENSYIQADDYGILMAGQQPQGFAPVLFNTITDNTIEDSLHGIYLLQSHGKVSGNTITNDNSDSSHVTQYGIDEIAPATIITENTIMFASKGVIIGVPSATVTANKLFSVGIGIDVGCFASGNISTNIIYAGGTGLLNVPSTFTGKNTIFNTTAATMGGC